MYLRSVVRDYGICKDTSGDDNAEVKGHLKSYVSVRDEELHSILSGLRKRIPAHEV